MNSEDFFDILAETDRKLRAYFKAHPAFCREEPEELRASIEAYPFRKGKRLRPAVLRMACGAVGGNPETALPAAAGIELFHTWTLVHDDIMDNDDTRRGEPTVHRLVCEKALEDPAIPDEAAEAYGRNMALLAGDLQHGWSVSCFAGLLVEKTVAPEVVVALIDRLQTHVLGGLIRGQALDVRFAAMRNEAIGEIPETLILEMMTLKTGILLGFSASAGAAIGKNEADFGDPDLAALELFATQCGVAFQLQDDILGLTADEKRLGKPVGSDIREGKKTLIVRRAWSEANPAQRALLLNTLGNDDATPEDVSRVVELLRELGGIEYARRLAEERIRDAQRQLERFGASKYVDFLRFWSDFMLRREL